MHCLIKSQFHFQSVCIICNNCFYRVHFQNFDGSRMVEREVVKWINVAQSLVLGSCKHTNEFFILLIFCWFPKENSPL
jgi:hypothetical protein